MTDKNVNKKKIDKSSESVSIKTKIRNKKYKRFIRLCKENKKKENLKL